MNESTTEEHVDSERVGSTVSFETRLWAAVIILVFFGVSLALCYVANYYLKQSPRRQGRILYFANNETPTRISSIIQTSDMENSFRETSIVATSAI